MQNLPQLKLLSVALSVVGPMPSQLLQVAENLKVITRVRLGVGPLLPCIRWVFVDLRVLRNDQILTISCCGMLFSMKPRYEDV